MQAEHVALLAEGVDRNKIDLQDTTGQTESPSSRRAWIEITKTTIRNLTAESRPPRGGRG